MLLGCLEVLLFDGFEAFSEMLVEYFEQEGHIAAAGIKGTESYFERLEVVVLLCVILEVVLLRGHREAANRQIHHLNTPTLTTSFTTLRYSYYQPRSQIYRLM